MNIPDLSAISWLTIGALTFALLSLALAVRQAASLRSHRQSFERTLAEERAKSSSELSLMIDRIVALESRSDADQIYLGHLDRLIGKRLDDTSEGNLDRLYAAIDVRLSECARSVWNGPFEDRVRQKLAEALLEELGRQAHDPDPRLKDALVACLGPETETFVKDWVHKDYSKLTGNAKTFAEAVWAEIGVQAVALDPVIKERIVARLAEEADVFAKRWIHRNYNDLSGNGKAFADAVWGEIGRQAATLDPLVRKQLVAQLAIRAAHFVETWVYKPSSLSGNSKLFGDAVWAEIGAQSRQPAPEIKLSIVEQLARDAARQVSEGLLNPSDERARPLIDRIWSEALEMAGNPSGNLRAALEETLRAHLQQRGLPRDEPPHTPRSDSEAARGA